MIILVDIFWRGRHGASACCWERLWAYRSALPDCGAFFCSGHTPLNAT